MSNLPEGWLETTLGAISDKPQYGWTTKARSAGPGLRLLRTTDITSGEIDWTQVPYCTDEPNDAERFLLIADDIVVSRAGSVGASIRLNAPPRAVFASYLIRIRVLGDVDPAYVAWFLRSPDYWRQVREAAVGIALLNVNAKKLAAIRIPLAPAPMQRRIVAVIEAQFSRLDAADLSLWAALRRLHVLRQTLLSFAIADGEERVLGELLDDIEAGKSFKCHGRPAEEGEWGVIKVSAMTWGAFDEGQNKAVLSADAADPRWEIRPGDLLLSRANTTDYVGATVLVGPCRRRLLLSDKSMRLHVKPDCDKGWLRHALSASRSRAQMSAVATGTSDSMRNVSQDKVKKIKLRVPTLSDQRRIAAEIDRRLTLVAALAADLERARNRGASLRRSILVRAFTGQLIPQDPADQPASVLLERIAAARRGEPKVSRKRRKVPA